MSMTYKCEHCGYETSDEIRFCRECGASRMKMMTERGNDSRGNNSTVKVIHNHVSNNAPRSESYFDGGLFQLIGWTILGAIVTFFTFGLCYPWALCMVYGWKINHTVINGRRLVFKGSAVSLFGNWIIWLVLSVITLGIYGFWVGIALEKWKVKNTEFAS